MSAPLRHTARTWTTIFFAAGLTFATSVAHAGYTVIDDDLLPTSFTEVAVPAHYLVSFTKRGSSLTDVGRNMLDAVLPLLRGATIRVVGRPDATVYSRGKLAQLARARANNIRNYLTRQGVPAESITVEIDDTPNPQPSGSVYPCDLYVTRSTDRALTRPAMYVPQNAPPAYVAASSYVQPPRPAPQPAPVTGSRDRLIQYINQAVSSGEMEPAVALRLLRSEMESDRNNVGSAMPAQQAQQQWRGEVPAAPAPRYAPQQLTAHNETWVLDKRLTLRENLDLWSRQAGWSPTVWEASSAFQITATSNVDGTFPSILRQVAESTGLNICAKVRERYVRVTDANVSCK